MNGFFTRVVRAEGSHRGGRPPLLELCEPIYRARLRSGATRRTHATRLARRSQVPFLRFPRYGWRNATKKQTLHGKATVGATADQ